MYIAFNIYSDLWNDCWVAATAPPRARRRRPATFNVAQRMGLLLHEHGPHSEQPLTMRIYGTMLKGFSTINNDRVRILLGQCERLVITFVDQPFLQKAQMTQLTPPKVHRPHKTTLDISMESFELEHGDWGKIFLEEGAMLDMGAEFEGETIPMTESHFIQPSTSLLEEMALLDESFPAVSGTLDAAKLGLGVETTLPEPSMAEPFIPEPSMPEPTMPEPSILEPTTPEAPCAGTIPLPMDTTTLPAAPPMPKQRRVPHRGIRYPPPGHVYGFDSTTQVSMDEFDRWQHDDEQLIRQQQNTPAYASQFSDLHWRPDRTLELATVFAPPEEQIDSAMHEVHVGVSPPAQSGVPSPPPAAVPSRVEFFETQMRPAEEEARPAVPSSIFAEFPTGAELPPPEMPQIPPRPFHQFVPEAPLPVGQQPTGEATELASHLQAAELLAAIRSFTPQPEAMITLDDVLPSLSTTRSTAARAFAALLALGSAGDVRLEQLTSYGPIRIHPAS